MTRAAVCLYLFKQQFRSSLAYFSRLLKAAKTQIGSDWEYDAVLLWEYWTLQTNRKLAVWGSMGSVWAGPHSCPPGRHGMSMGRKYFRGMFVVRSSYLSKLHWPPQRSRAVGEPYYVKVSGDERRSVPPRPFPGVCRLSIHILKVSNCGSKCSRQSKWFHFSHIDSADLLIFFP